MWVARLGEVTVDGSPHRAGWLHGEWGALPSEISRRQRHAAGMSGLVAVVVLLGLALLVAELRSRGRGLLAATGIAAVIGAVLLAVFGPLGSFAIGLAMTLPVLAALGALGVVAIRQVISASRQRARCGAEGLVGQIGVVRRPPDPLGHVAIDGELWRARRSWAEEDDAPPAAGEPVVVDHVQGLTLTVRRAEIWEVER
jgi:membrane-bound ClpP family serine protease